MLPHTYTRPVTDSGFEQRLIDGIRPIAEHFLAGALHHLFDTGVFDALAARPDGRTPEALAEDLSLEPERLTGLLRYLANEGVIAFDGDTARLTTRGRGYGEFRAWYTMMIGGYTSTLSQMGPALRRGSAYCTREGRYVGLGSCEVSRYDGMPMTRELLARAGADCGELLDLGCGNGLYLVDFCRSMPELRAWGVEPDPGGYQEARELVGEAGLSDRVQVINASATDFFAAPPEGCRPDLTVLAFVLHEILAQRGRTAVVELLQGLVKAFPALNVVVIEVADESADPAIMRHGLATNFWNPYYLIHSFTEQQLEKKSFWDELFEDAGLTTVAFVTTDETVDSTGLELGYLLRGPGHS
ncbi:2-ketoarginine methyltransferase [Amycolatopsis sp. QT-25]|uniref:2-ketoarginine methyltransferase n=1 Tax=Amycolatopsis sp. QT-25 TaxID=3034022 RepID=UPI0023ECFDAC|nr:2-ketoarginine methyltransferase [Amycolatopsis sp. QT-25]WET76263.1 2-ketoarginine methyltransferase [Amycolatopsis sp. QT-25]